jgi:hypothetical protein
MVLNRMTRRKFKSFDIKGKISAGKIFCPGGSLAKSAARESMRKFIGSENFVNDKLNLGN